MSLQESGRNKFDKWERNKGATETETETMLSQVKVC